MHVRELLKKIATLRTQFIKAAIFAIAWAFFPFWLFLLIALYIYFVPLGQARKLIIPFIVLLILSAIEPSGILFGFIFGAVFFYLLLIKDLFLIDRKSAYEILVLFLSFLLFRDFYMYAGDTIGSASLIYSGFTALVFGLLVFSFISNFDDIGKVHLRRIAGWLSFILAWQMIIAGLFLPVDFIYQTVVVFLIAVFMVDLLPEYLFGDLSPVKIFTTSSVIFTMLAIVLASARWGI